MNAISRGTTGVQLFDSGQIGGRDKICPDLGLSGHVGTNICPDICTEVYRLEEVSTKSRKHFPLKKKTIVEMTNLVETGSPEK